MNKQAPDPIGPNVCALSEANPIASRSIMLTTDAVGGVWRYSLELAVQLAAQGVQVLLATMGPRPDERQSNEALAIAHLRLINTDLPLDWLAATPAELHHAVRELARLAACHDVHSVHLHTPALAAHAEWNRPVVAVAHSCVGTWWDAVHGGELPPDLAWRAEVIARGLAAADMVIAPSHSFSRDLIAHYPTAPRIEVVWNGRRPLTGLVPRQAQIFTAGRLWDPGKNVATIDAAACFLDIPVIAAGSISGPHRVGIECPHLCLLGSLDEAAMAEQYAAAAIFVSMARYEPFGLSVLEAAQAGCALILSNIATFRELWDGAAVFVDPSDARALADAAQKCLRTPGRCDDLGRAARQRAARFTAESMAARTLQIHQGLHATLTTQSAA